MSRGPSLETTFSLLCHWLPGVGDGRGAGQQGGGMAAIKEQSLGGTSSGKRAIRKGP